MKNSVSITGFQFDIKLPVGVSIRSYSLSSGRTSSYDDHSLSYSLVADNTIRFICTSNSNKLFTGRDGEIMQIKVDVADDMTPLYYPLYMKSIEVTPTSGTGILTDMIKSLMVISNYVVGDANGDDRVSVSDAATIVSYILGGSPANFNVKAADANRDTRVSVSDVATIVSIVLTGGNSAAKAKYNANDNSVYIDDVSCMAGSQAVLNVCLDNAGDYVNGFQFDLTLPNGITIDNKGNGQPLVNFNKSLLICPESMSLSAVYMEPNVVRVIGYTTDGSCLNRSDKTLLALPFSVDKTVSTGSYVVDINNIELASDGYADVLSNMHSVVDVCGVATGIVEVGKSKSGKVFDLFGRQLNTMDKAHRIYIVDGKKVIK